MKGTLPTLILATVCAVCLPAAGCDDPTALREPFPDPALMVVLALDPDAADQYMLLRPAAVSGRIEAPRVEIRQDDVVVAVGGPVADSANELRPCARTFGADPSKYGAQPRCLEIQFQPAYGQTYEVVVTADDRPTARARTTVPGAFEISGVEAAGMPPGTDHQEASWTASEGVDRYVVAVHADAHPFCLEGTCEDLIGSGKNLGWQVWLRETAITTRVVEQLVEGGEGAWYFRVAAMDRALADHLSSGSNSELFPVPPVSNVDGGVGVVGSWVTRVVELTP